MRRVFHRLPGRRAAGFAALVLALLVLLPCAPARAAEDSARGERVLRVAFPITRGISEIDRYGQRTGMLVDYLNEIAKFTGWRYEYIGTDTDSLIDDFLAGRFDLMGGTYYSPAFEEYFAYPQYSMGSSRAVLLARRDDRSLKSYDPRSLGGKTIGVYERASERIQKLEEYLAANGVACAIKRYTFEELSAEGNLYRFLRSGEVDMLLGNDLEAADEFRAAAFFDAQPYYIVTHVGEDELLEELDGALERILDARPEFSTESHNAHFPDALKTDAQFTGEELAFMKERPELTVAVVAGWHPFYCDGKTDSHAGVVPDLFAKLSDYTGLRFTFTAAANYREAIDLVRQGRADIMGFYLGSDETAFADGLALTRSYVRLSDVVLKNKSVRYPSAGLRGGILAGRTMPAQTEAGEVRYYSTPRDGLRAVDRGEIDFFYGLAALTDQEFQNRRYPNVVSVSRADSVSAVSIAAPRPIRPELLTILNKAVGSLSTEETDALLDRNLVSEGLASLSLPELLYANPVAFMAIFGAFLLLLVAGVLLAARARVKSSLMKAELEKAQAKSRAKSEFLSQMSHEIRTPMNAIVGLTDLCRMEQGLPAGAAEKLRKIRSSSQYMLSLINDILDMSRIENGRMELVPEEFSLGAMLDDLARMMEPQAGQKGLRFESARGIAHDRLVADPVRLRQVLLNLLSNAVKFTPEGGTVRLRAEETDCGGDGAQVRFSVEDTGVGIAPEDRERIFRSFEQLGTSSSRSAGTGLGLPISSSIVRTMGGDIGVESTPGKGSRFFFTLRFPLGTQTPPSPGRETAPESLEGIRVLLAEDNDLNAEIAMELLESQGVASERARDGLEAVAMFEQSAPGYYQLVLMDIRMPNMDGLEAARRLRAGGHPEAASVPIVAMTANSFREDEEAAAASGMTGFVAKPVDLQVLCRAMREALRPGAEPEG